jgi:hypothetical protein
LHPPTLPKKKAEEPIAGVQQSQSSIWPPSIRRPPQTLVDDGVGVFVDTLGDGAWRVPETCKKVRVGQDVWRVGYERHVDLLFPSFPRPLACPGLPMLPRLSSVSSKRRADIKQSNATRSICAQECSEKDVAGWCGRPSAPLFRLPSDRHHPLSCVVCVASDAPVLTKAGFWASPTELFVSRHACLPLSFL